MRKIGKFTLEQTKVNPNDILRKKQMGNILGGIYYCIYQCGSSVGSYFCSTMSECYDMFGDDSYCPGGGGLHCS